MNERTYLVRLVSAFTGEFASDQRLFVLDDMLGWKFYDDPEEWDSWYEDYSARTAHYYKQGGNAA